jgi:hypothetical protein
MPIPIHLALEAVLTLCLLWILYLDHRHTEYAARRALRMSEELRLYKKREADRRLAEHYGQHGITLQEEDIATLRRIPVDTSAFYLT